MSDNPVVVLNHAIAAAMVHCPSKGFELLRALDSDARLAGHHRLDADDEHAGTELLAPPSGAGPQGDFHFDAPT
jgi:predicted RNA polymerase sigma factor